MPDFNTFRINELLLGKVLVARQRVDFSITESEQLEVRQFLQELEEKKRDEKSTVFLRFIGFLTGKKYIQLRDNFGQRIVREVNSEIELKPELRISLTIERQIDFGDDVNEWRKYVHEENIRTEQRIIDKKIHSENRKILIDAYSEIINKKMMKIN
jgi:hypothetical protein